MMETSPDYIEMLIEMFPYAVCMALGWWAGWAQKKHAEARAAGHALLWLLHDARQRGWQVNPFQASIIERAKEYLK